jgi:adiponectin receptor
MSGAESVSLLGEARPRQQELQLYSIEFVPTELRRPWIHSGYRACPLPTRLCMLSALHPTNETLNVWSHLLALGLFAWRSGAGRGFAGSRADHAAELLLLAAAQACFALSASFHLLNTASLSAFRLLHKADVAGILGLICACFLAGLQLAFGCAPRWAAGYQAAIGCGSGALLCAFVRSESVPRGAVAGMIALVALSIVPIAHWICLMATAEELVLFFPRLARFFALLGIGVAFYGTGLPERWAPGRFDVWGHSHTWWHVFVALAIDSYYASLVDFSEWRQAHVVCPGVAVGR